MNTIAGLDISLEDLSTGTLIVGDTGSGKTSSLINPIAASLAGARSKPAVFYFNIKGSGARDFIASLPRERRRDVVQFTNAPTDTNRLELFPWNSWPNGRELGSTVIEHVKEAARHAAGTSDQAGSHKIYWDAQRDDILQTLIQVGSKPRVPGGRFMCPSAHQTLMRRIEGFRRHMQTFFTQTDRQNLLFEELSTHERAELIKWVKTLIRTDFSGQPFEAQRKLVKILSQSFKETAEKDPFERWVTELPADERRAIEGLAQRRGGSGEQNYYCVDGEISSVVQPDAGLRFLHSEEPLPAVSFEQAIDEGKILVFDLPVSGNPGLLAGVISLVLAAMTVILARNRLVRLHKPIDQERPIVFVLDEFHTMLSRGRHSGLERFLAQCREFRCVTLLATQSLHLVASAINDRSRFSALIGGIGSAIFGKTHCPYTIEYAVHRFGTSARARMPVLLPSDADEDLRAALTCDSEEREVLSARTLPKLQVGEFVAALRDGRRLRLDLSRKLPKPILSDLLQS